MDLSPDHVSLADVQAQLKELPPEEIAALEAQLYGDAPLWFPTVGPQYEAYVSPADVLLYGGQAAGGKTDLGLGLAFTEQQDSLILRRQYTDMSGLYRRAIEINTTRDGFSGQIPPTFHTINGKLIQFGAHKDLGDEMSWMGIPFDFKFFDEAWQHLEMQIKLHLGWIRSAKPGQRCRAVLGSNPPLDSSGDWMIKMFRPWLDVAYEPRAKPGELRWFITDENGDDAEVPDATPVERYSKLSGKVETYQPKSRSFIPSALGDNPFLVNTGYQATLDALPEPIRTAVRDGNFLAARADADRQVIPVQWVIEAQARWRRDGYKGRRMKAMGYDPSGGGRDPAMLAMRYESWYAELEQAKGEETTDGSKTVAFLFQFRRDNAEIVIDVGGGYGSQTCQRLTDNDTAFTAFDGNGTGVGRDKSGRLKFTNKRAEAWWRFRESLDPDQPGGSDVALPMDDGLKAELCAPTFTITKAGITIESKDEIRKRLGRSTNRADAVVMAGSAAEASIRKRESLGGARPLPTQAQSTRQGALQRRRARR